MAKMLAVLSLALAAFNLSHHTASAIFVDKGDPYKLGPLKVGQLTLTKTLHGSPLHTTVFYPLEEGDYVPIFFVGGLGGLIPTEMYTDFQTQLASHGFVIFGVDPYFPALHDGITSDKIRDESKPRDDVNVGVNVEPFFQQLDWLHGYMNNRTEARVAWNYTVLACHSAGCDDTLSMLRHNHTVAKASVYLEPFSSDAKNAVPVNIPTLSYGTELSEKGLFHCAVAGKDWRQFYQISPCPKILMEVKDFGHCDILDPLPWEACHDTHYCATTNNSRNAEYHQFVQGVVSAFLIGTLEGNTATLTYILNTSSIPLPLLDLRNDLDCELY